MRIQFAPGETSVTKSADLSYAPSGWSLRYEDAGYIVPLFRGEYHNDFHVHVSDRKSDYCTSYDSTDEFLKKAFFSGRDVTSVSFSLPVQDIRYGVTIDIDENKIRFWSNERTAEEMLCFDRIMRKVSHLLNQAESGTEHAFTKDLRNHIFTREKKPAFQFLFASTLRLGDDLIVLEAFDRRFRLGRINTYAWDYEWHFWRSFDSFDEYRQEAPGGDFYESLSEADFDIVIDGAKYSVRLALDSLVATIQIEFDKSVTSPYDFEPMMETLEKDILKRKKGRT